MANEANKEYVKLKLTNVIRITRLVSVHYLEYEKNFVFDGESHDFWEMVYVDMGDVVIHADEEEFQLHQGEMVFHKPNEFHKIRANGVTASNVFIVSFVCQSPAMRFFYGKRMKLPLHLKSFISHIIAESRSAFILPCFDPSSKELKVNENAPIGAQQLVGLYLELLLILLLREDEKPPLSPLVFASKESFDNHLVSQIIGFMDEHIYGTLSIREICEHVNYGKTFVSNTFKKATGYPVMQYYNMLKIAEAKKMIREGIHNYTQIANRLCFDNPHYFTRVFKRICGMTPKEYQMSVWADLPE